MPREIPREVRERLRDNECLLQSVNLPGDVHERLLREIRDFNREFKARGERRLLDGDTVALLKHRLSSVIRGAQLEYGRLEGYRRFAVSIDRDLERVIVHGIVVHSNYVENWTEMYA